MGLTDLSDADATQQIDIRRAINAGIDEIGSRPPMAWYGTDEFVGVLSAPATISSIAVTQNSKSYTSAEITAGLASYGGQAILIGGDEAVTNRIVRKIDATGELLVPYGASTGTVGGTIYFDTLPMPSDFFKLNGDISVIGSGGVIQVDGQVDMGSPYGLGRQPSGTPTRARVIARTDASKYRSFFLKFDSLTNTSIRVFFEYRRRPARIAALTDERYDLIPNGFEDSVLIPICISKLAGITSAVQVPPQFVAEGVISAGSILAQAADAQGNPDSHRTVSALD
jgi:hypothetical protein